jgi:pyruvyl transferase EpsI
MNALKKLIPFRLKVKYHILRMNLTQNPVFQLKDYPKGKKIFLFLAADYGNLGDVALTYAEIQYLKQHLPDHSVVEIITRDSIEGIHFAKKHAGPNDLISILGGGNMGSIYPGLENIRQIIIDAFPNHKIISFPQSIHFANTKEGHRALQKAISVYSRHKKLTLVARDKKSYSLMHGHFKKNQVLLTPDIVFTQNQTEPALPRSGVILSLRQDLEKGLTNQQEKILNQLIAEHFEQITHYDTNIGHSFLSNTDKYAALQDIWAAYKKAQLIVTDRLHGMIFAYITRTPCLVLPNNNHKIEAAYDWIRFSNSVVLIKDFSESSIRDGLIRFGNQVEMSHYQDMETHFEPLRNAIQSQ